MVFKHAQGPDKHKPVASFILGSRTFEVTAAKWIRQDSHTWSNTSLVLLAQSKPGHGAQYKIQLTYDGGDTIQVHITLFHHGDKLPSAMTTYSIQNQDTMPGLIRELVKSLHQKQHTLEADGIYLTRDPQEVAEAAAESGVRYPAQAAAEPQAGSFLFRDIRRFPDVTRLPGLVHIGGLPFATVFYYNDNRSSLLLQCTDDTHDIEFTVDVDEKPQGSLNAFCTRRTPRQGADHRTVDLDVPEKVALTWSAAQLRAHVVTELNKLAAELQHTRILPTPEAQAAAEPPKHQSADNLFVELRKMAHARRRVSATVRGRPVSVTAEIDDEDSYLRLHVYEGRDGRFTDEELVHAVVERPENNHLHAEVYGGPNTVNSPEQSAVLRLGTSVREAISKLLHYIEYNNIHLPPDANTTAAAEPPVTPDHPEFMGFRVPNELRIKFMRGFDIPISGMSVRLASDSGDSVSVEFPEGPAPRVLYIRRNVMRAQYTLLYNASIIAAEPTSKFKSIKEVLAHFLPKAVEYKRRPAAMRRRAQAAAEPQKAPEKDHAFQDLVRKTPETELVTLHGLKRAKTFNASGFQVRVAHSRQPLFVYVAIRKDGAESWSEAELYNEHDGTVMCRMVVRFGRRVVEHSYRLTGCATGTELLRETFKYLRAELQDYDHATAAAEPGAALPHVTPLWKQFSVACRKGLEIDIVTPGGRQRPVTADTIVTPAATDVQVYSQLLDIDGEFKLRGGRVFWRDYLKTGSHSYEESEVVPQGHTPAEILLSILIQAKKLHPGTKLLVKAQAAAEPQPSVNTSTFMHDLIAYVESGAGSGANMSVPLDNGDKCRVTALPLALDPNRLVELLLQVEFVLPRMKHKDVYWFSIETTNRGGSWTFELRKVKIINGARHQTVIAKGDASKLLQTLVARTAHRRSMHQVLPAVMGIVGAVAARLRDQTSATAAAEPQLSPAARILAQLKAAEKKAGDDPIGSKTVNGRKYMFTGAGDGHHDDPEVHAWVSLPAPPEYKKITGSDLFDLAKVEIGCYGGTLRIEIDPVDENTDTNQHALFPIKLREPESASKVISHIIDVVAREVKPKQEDYV